ncbi:MAG: NYN domain-containing protein [Thermomicrobiales bacterium]
MAIPRIHVYVDGFNFYYGLFQGQSPYSPALKWLNIVKLSEAVCRSQHIEGSVQAVRYCSAPSLPSATDREQPMRQELLFRALRALPEVTIILGQHVERTKKGKLFGPDGKPQKYSSRVSAREEKGPDVNLAAYIVSDAALDEFDVAVVMSNDSDLENAIRIVRDDFSKDVYIASPQFQMKEVTRALTNASIRAFKINPSLLTGCTFSNTVMDEHGALITKPLVWNDKPVSSDEH